MTRPAVAPADVVYERLRTLIQRGELQPNERLIEVDLAQRLQATRARIRTALVRLGQDGMVVLTPNRGARVKLVSESEAVEILQTRRVLEGLAARQAALHATAREIAELRRVLTRMGQKLEQGDLLGYSEGNAALHAGVIAASRHDTAARLITGLRGPMVRFQFRTILVPGRPTQSYAEHITIVQAIADHDPDAAETAMRAHLAGVERTLSRTAGAAARRLPS